MKPRQCKCGCWVADHLRRCPKCNTKVKRRNKEDDKAEQRQRESERLVKLNANAKVLSARKLKWIVPKEAQAARVAQIAEIRKRLQAGDKSVRTELQMAKAFAKLKRHGRWSWEYPPKRYNEKGEVVVTRGERPIILVSPKGNRYVKAHPNEYAHLILDYGEKDERGWRYPSGNFQLRLRKYEKSSIAKQSKKQAREEKERRAALRERKKAKKKRRLEKRKLKARST